jgi:hypothetical protein
LKRRDGEVPRRIKITAGSVSAVAELNMTGTADSIWQELPMNATANTWGDEIYFSIPAKMGLENGQEVVEAGDLGYWPPGSAFCIFFGPTPASRGNEIRPASAVNVFGKLVGDLKVFKTVKGGDSITIDRSQE